MSENMAMPLQDTPSFSHDAVYPWLVNTLEQLRERAQLQNLHHAILMIADDGVGEGVLIEKLAKTLLCQQKSACGQCKSCLVFAAKSHPDFVEVISDKPSIGVDAIRKVSEFVVTTSQLLGNKVVVINAIERMTEAASNALLKTLEEPNNNTFLLLSTTQASAVLATIKSRCEKIRLQLPNASDALTWLKSQTNENVSAQGLRAYCGSALLYLDALRNSHLNYNEFSADIQALSKQTVSALNLAQKWQLHADLALRWTYLTLQQRIEKGLNSGASARSLTDLFTLSEQCQQANSQVSQAGINKQLILTNMFNHLQSEVL